MQKLEIMARSGDQALKKAAKRLELESTEDLTILEEYDPDEQDLETLAKEEAEEGAGEQEGEPGLYIVGVGADRFVKIAHEWLSKFAELLWPGTTVDVRPEGEAIRATFDCDEASILIGKQGQTLQALQHVASRALGNQADDFPPLLLDVGDYREKRESRLDRVARSAAQKAKRSRRSVALEPMNSMDRKYIHNLLKEIGGVTTRSEGREPDRYLIIEPAGGGARRGGSDGGGEVDGNRWDVGPDPDRRGGGGGGGRGRGGRGRGSGINDERYQQPSPFLTEEARRKALGLGDDDEDYKDVAIEEKASRLPAFREGATPDYDYNKDAPLADELE